MKHLRCVLAVALLSSVSPAYGQGASAPPAQSEPDAPEPAAPSTFPIHGSFDVGYRFQSVSGSEETFRQFYDLSEGLRVFGIDLHSMTGIGPGAFADRFSVTASGLGGDPYSTLQLTLSKARRYNLRVNWRRSRFFDIAPSTPDAIAGFDTRAVTNRHSWTTARQIGNVAWTFDATNRLHVLFNYDAVSNSGAVQTTRALDYVGASATWAAFARANPFPLLGPTDNSANRLTGGISYNHDRWTLNYRAGFQTLRDEQTLTPQTASERSINVVDAATANETLTALTWSQTRQLRTPISELTAVARLSSTLEWRGGYLFYRYRGPFDLDSSFQGFARTNSAGSSVSPYDVTARVEGTASTPNQVLDHAITWRPRDRWAFEAGYRYSRSSTTADAVSTSVVAFYPPATTAPVTTSTDVLTEWRNDFHSLDLTTTWTPLNGLTLRPGVRLVQRDVEMQEDGVIEPGASNRERAVWPQIMVGYRPNPRFSTRGSYQTAYSDSPYTRMSAIQRSIGHLMVHAEPLPGFTIEASANRTDAEWNDAGFASHARSGSVTLAYALSNRLSVNGGLDYQSFLGTGSGTFLRGTLPIADLVLIDREIDRVWHGGITIRPFSRLGVTASANYDRISGTDTIAGEPPLYGASSFPYATGTIYYELSKAGRISVDLQHTSLSQELLPSNDFRARLVTVRFTRDF